jgi:nucleotidyltransferase substrate binding protein (TIGR01987 family)
LEDARAEIDIQEPVRPGRRPRASACACPPSRARGDPDSCRGRLRPTPAGRVRLAGRRDGPPLQRHRPRAGGEPLPFDELGRLSDALEDSELPYRVDAVNLAETSRRPLAASLTSAAAFLAKALDTEASDIQQAASIRAFEFCFELSWKLLKERLREEGVDAATPKAVLRTAGDAGMIDSVEEWLGYLAARNLTSHTYNKAVADQVYGVISGGFLAATRALV